MNNRLTNKYEKRENTFQSCINKTSLSNKLLKAADKKKISFVITKEKVCVFISFVSKAKTKTSMYTYQSIDKYYSMCAAYTSNEIRKKEEKKKRTTIVFDILLNYAFFINGNSRENRKQLVFFLRLVLHII